MTRVLITPHPISGVKPFELQGKLTSKFFPNDGGLFYYINGQSFHESIVEILEGSAE